MTAIGGWLEIVKLAVSIAVPLFIAILGIILVRWIEGAKAEVARKSDFDTEWATQFFGCCQEFLVSMERELAVLTVIFDLDDPNGELGTDLQKEASRLHPKLSELELRIRRSVVFAPTKGDSVIQAAGNCLRLMRSMVQTIQSGGHVSIDPIIEEMNGFNRAAREAHREMLRLPAESGRRAKRRVR